VFSQSPQQSSIDLTWNPNSDSDLAGYNVYRRTDNTQPVKLNTDLVKTPAFRDTGVQPGSRYFYSVSAVDLRNNESARSPEASETVPQ
jgi:fibronectin type 3 domain-containing protein